MSGDILLTCEPWVGGTRASGYWGPLVLRRVVPGSAWVYGIDGILEAAAEAARTRSMNAVVGIEIECDPYHPEGGHIELKGTLALLEPLFAGLEMAP